MGTILENIGFGHNSAADWLILAKLCAKTQNPSVWPSNVRQNSENSRWRAELHQNLRYERICYTIYCLNGVFSSPSSTIGWYTYYYYWLTLLLLRHRFRPGASDNRVVVGMHNLRQPDSFTQTIRVTEIIPMAKYGRPPRQNSNDIMLLKLETAITFNDAVSPVCLPTQFKPIASGRRCYSTGWGALRGQISHSNSYRAHASAVSCWRG